MRVKATLTITPAEAAEILTKCGFGIGYDKIAEALRKGGIFPFGVAYEMPSQQWAYIIYRKDLYDFIRAHGGEPPEESEAG